MLLLIRSSPISETISDFSFIVLSTGITAVSSAALFAALCAAALLVPSAILFVRQTWALRLSALMLVLCGVEWLRTAALLVMRRASEGRPWGTALAILLLCALLSWISLAALRGRKKPA